MNTDSHKITLSVMLTLTEIRDLVASYAASQKILPKVHEHATPLGKIVEEAKSYCILEVGDVVSWSEYDIDEKFSIKEINEDRVTLQILNSNTELIVDSAEIDFISSKNNPSYNVMKEQEDSKVTKILSNV